MGKKLGLLVMLLDIFKSYLAAKIAQKIFAKYILAGLLASLGAMIGHTYSMFLHFHGGKGVAAFGGMILFYKPAFFWLVVIIAIVLMLVTNLGVAGPCEDGITIQDMAPKEARSPARMYLAKIFWAIFAAR